ncbi:MAG: DUF3231 family protein [Peptococcaceae bacterium]|nr:DUF3231 family protein [Peptococcaceae bacterium]
MDIKSLFKNTPTDKLHWGEALGLWDIARYKVMGLTILEIFLAQAKDRDLKHSLSDGVEMLIIPHIEKIQKFLHQYGLESPTVPQRKNLDVVGKKIEPNTFIEDDEIANDIREIFRFGLELDMKGLTSSTRDDVRSLIWEILNDDYKGFDAMLKLHRKKNWLIPPPTV